MTSLPLAGITVLDFSRFLPAPFCTWMLAQMGARIIRAENPRELVKQAQTFNYADFDDQQLRARRRRDILASNKESLLLDFGHEQTPAFIAKLVGACDIVIEDYRRGVLDKLGLGYESLSAANPGLIYCSITLCGSTGPLRDQPGHDSVALAQSGALSRFGENPDAPQFVGAPVADMLTGYSALSAILAALHGRSQTGKGTHLDIAMSDASMALLIPMLSRNDADKLPPRGQRRPDTGIWETSDGRFVCTTDMEPAFWARFCETIGRPQYIKTRHDPEQREAIIDDIASIMRTRTRDEWVDILRAVNCQVAPVLEPVEALADAHNIERGMVKELPSGERHIVSPLKFGEASLDYRPAGLPGEDARTILASLGFAADAIDRLTSDGVVAERLDMPSKEPSAA